MRLRSLLFVPGDRPERMEKALGVGADALILDLEDSVAPDHKALARSSIRKFVSECQRSIPLLIRVNPLGSGLTDRDLDALSGLKIEGIVLPKAEGAASVMRLSRALELSGLAGARIIPIGTETPRAIFQLGSYAEVSDSLLGLTWGAEDLPAAVGAMTAREEDGRYTAPYEMARSLTLFGAAAAGVLPLETVYPQFRDLDGLDRYAGRARRDGFAGMMAIHPSQIDVINHAFTPSDSEIAKARTVIEAFDAHPGAGVLTLDGRMVDAPHLKQARLTLERASG